MVEKIVVDILFMAAAAGTVKLLLTSQDYECPCSNALLLLLLLLSGITNSTGRKEPSVREIKAYL